MLDAFLFCRADCESALGSSTLEPDSQSGRFYNACPHFETHPALLGDLTEEIRCVMLHDILQ